MYVFEHQPSPGLHYMFAGLFLLKQHLMLHTSLYSIFSVARLSKCYCYCPSWSSDSSLTLSPFLLLKSNQSLSPIYFSHLPSPETGLVCISSQLEDCSASDNCQHFILLPLKSPCTLLPLKSLIAILSSFPTL